MKLFLLFTAIFISFSVIARAESLSLEIEASQNDLQEILREAIRLPSVFKTDKPLDERWLRHYRKQLPELVDKTLEPYGYFQSQTQTKLSTLEGGGSTLTVQVNPGQPVRITVLKLQFTGPGSTLAEVRELRNKFPLKNNDILRQDLYEQGKALLLQGCVELGFLDARFSRHQIQVFQNEQRADIALTLETGNRYRFGATIYSGQNDYPAPFLNRFLSYREDEPFSHLKLGQTQLNLINSDLFRAVTVTPAQELARDDSVPIRIELEPYPRHRLRPGIGYGTDTGARASLRYHDLNLFSSGHELEGNLLIAQLKQSLLTTYTIPDPVRLDSQIHFRLGYDQEESESYLSRKLYSEAEYQRTFGGNLQGALFLQLSQEYSKVGQEKNRTQMLLPGFRLRWHDSDRQVAPRSGFQGNLELKGADSTFFSDTSLLQLIISASSIFPLPQQFSLILRGQGGTTWHEDPLHELPASLRFFAGGDRSVRGYAYQSLGPRDETGEVVGGSHLLVGNIELEKRFTDNWGGAIFYDIGNAFDTFTKYELEQGAGLGVRRYTPIGPIRLDLARQIGQSSPRWRVHLSIGFGW